ncbi:MAG: hypothetical protein J3K34DRAFT_139836 [Monoraphidium minutum]|nr:MAG: hypothetical protein J3K34DRAFT_139836 [Monoraphidium minutum]
MAFVINAGSRAFTAAAAPAPRRAGRVAARRAVAVRNSADDAQRAEMEQKLQAAMQDPAMQERMKAMQEAMQRPEMQQQMAAMEAAMRNEALQKRMEELRGDPELAGMFEEIKKGGMGALMKFWNDPKTLAKLGEKLGDVVPPPGAVPPPGCQTLTTSGMPPSLATWRLWRTSSQSARTCPWRTRSSARRCTGRRAWGTPRWRHCSSGRAHSWRRQTARATRRCCTQPATAAPRWCSCCLTPAPAPPRATATASPPPTSPPTPATPSTRRPSW